MAASGPEPRRDRAAVRLRRAARGLATALATTAVVVRLAAAGPAPSAAPRVVAADRTGFTIELLLPAPRFEPPVEGGPCGRLTLGAVPGSPAPPAGEVTYGWLVGVPEPGGAFVEALAVAETTRDPPWPICATMRPEADRRLTQGRALAELANGTVEPAAEDLPRASWPVATLAAAGDLRGQAVARLLVRPVARTADGRLVVRSRVQLRIAYRRPATIVQGPPEPGPFAPVFDQLLNRRFLPRRAQAAPDAALLDPGGPSSPAPATWLAPADPRALKVVVDRDGPVVVAGADLAAAGWQLAEVDPAGLGLSVGGHAIPFSLDGLARGHLVATSRLVFQGQAMTGQYTRENVYWLRQHAPGPELAERDVTPGGAVAARGFTRQLSFEQDTRWLASLDPRDGDDRWMWGDALNAADMTQRALSVTLTVGSLAPLPAAAQLRIRLQGYTGDAKVTPDHHVRVTLNGRVLGELRFDGMGAHVADLTVPAGGLGAGDNKLVLQAPGDTGALIDQVYLDRVTLTMSAGYRATDDRLEFAAPDAAGMPTAFALSGFGAAPVSVWDVTDAERPIRLTGVVTMTAGDGSVGARLQDAAPAGRRYVAFTPAGARPPARIVPNGASDWRSAGNGADYVVISHPDFTAALQPLVARRQAQGLRTAVVSIDDIYDEFAFGVFDPRAIRSFLQHAARQWAPPAPTYVLLVGESNLDYRRGYNSGPINYVPSVTLDTAVAATELTAYTSDLWFATLGADDLLPDVFIGRFSVSTAEQARTVVAKTLRYEGQPPTASWRRRAVLVADDTDALPMEQLSESLAGHLPPDVARRRFYAARYPLTGTLAADIGSALNDGALVLNFAGHANVALWSPWPGGGYIFDNGGIAALRNGDAMPLFTAATCMNGWIDHPLKPVAMGELWLTHPAGGGAVAWAASGFSATAVQERLFAPVYDGLFDGGTQPIGALITAAEVNALTQNPGLYDLVGMYILLGDPALVVSGVPPRPTPTPGPTRSSAPPPAYLPSVIQPAP